MAVMPWWMGRVGELLESKVDVGAAAVGPLWHLEEQLGFVRENVILEELPPDFEAFPSAGPLWRAFEQREAAIAAALERSVSGLAQQLRSGELPFRAFRESWERLGFAPHPDGGGTPADDYLDAITNVSRLTVGELRPSGGNVNLSSRALRIADFLAVTEPDEDDRVIDIGSGSGKFALTVAASTAAQVRGIEYGESYVQSARTTAEFLGVKNLEFVFADVREVSLDEGTIFFLYHPFHGAVAKAVAQTLGRLARATAITLYVQGPESGFAEHFLAEVTAGALELSERRGEFDEVLVLRSARS